MPWIVGFVLVLAGCAESYVSDKDREGRRVLDVVVSDAWDTERQVAILEGLGFWREQLADKNVVFLVTIGKCDELMPGCVAPVPIEHPWLRDFDDTVEDGMVVGHVYRDAIVMWDSMPAVDLDLLAAHELGHFMGLGHEEHGIMAPGTGNMSFEVTPSVWAHFASLGI